MAGPYSQLVPIYRKPVPSFPQRQESPYFSGFNGLIWFVFLYVWGVTPNERVIVIFHFFVVTFILVKLIKKITHKTKNIFFIEKKFVKEGF